MIEIDKHKNEISGLTPLLNLVHNFIYEEAGTMSLEFSTQIVRGVSLGIFVALKQTHLQRGVSPQNLRSKNNKNKYKGA